jgi:hypothetical protein
MAMCIRLPVPGDDQSTKIKKKQQPAIQKVNCKAPLTPSLIYSEKAAQPATGEKRLFFYPYHQLNPVHTLAQRDSSGL